jgi:hypothetical protein
MIGKAKSLKPEAIFPMTALWKKCFFLLIRMPLKNRRDHSDKNRGAISCFCKEDWI